MADSDEFVKLKKKYEDVMSAFNLNGKTVQQVAANTAFKRNILAEALVSIAGICGEAIAMHEKKSSPPDIDIVSRVKDAITDLVPSIVTDVLKSNGIMKTVTPTTKVPESEKHVIVLEDKDDASKVYDDSIPGLRLSSPH